MSLKNIENKDKLLPLGQNNNILSLIMKNYKEKNGERYSEVYFLIQIINNISNKKWEIEKTIIDFQTLYEKLFILYPNLPSIPKKSLFKITSLHILDKRKYALQNFLQHCIRRKDLLLNEDFIKFLEIPKNSPELVGNSVQKLEESKKLDLSIKSFLYIKNKSILFVLLSNNDFISRDEVLLDNFLNIKNNYSQVKKPLGYVIIYEFVNSKNDKNNINNFKELKLNKLWEKSFLIQTNIIIFDELKEYLCIGNDDGKIFIYKTKIEGNFKEMEILTELNFHSDRLSGLYFDSKNMNLYSCSYDNTFFVIDLKDNVFSKSLIYNNMSGFTGLKYMKNNNLLIASDEDGIISLYSIENNHYKFYLDIQSKSLDTISSMKIYEYFVITGANNGKVSVFDLSLIKNKSINEIITIDIGRFKITSIDYNWKNNEIIIGDENGRIIIWNNNIRKFINSWIAHSQSKINNLLLENDEYLLWTCGDDKIIKKWKIPRKWFKEDIYLYNIDFNDKQNENKIFDLEEKDSISSDEDELNGWSNNENS